MSLSILKKAIKDHGKTKVAVALGLTETNAINNWLVRKTIPVKQKSNVKNLKNLQFIDIVWMPKKVNL